MTLLRLTEGLWECETTILGHCFDYCRSFIWRNANPPLHNVRKRVAVANYFPMYIHCTSLALLWCFTIKKHFHWGSTLTAIILNISLFWQHYHIQLITIFLFFSLFWKDESFPREENHVTWNTEARFIGSWGLIYVANLHKDNDLLSQYWHFPKI